MAETNTPTTPAGNTPTATTIDYEKLASIVSGKQTATEDSVLKGYFKQQGLSSEEMQQAIATFKEQKAKNTPNIEEMQSTIESLSTAEFNAKVQQNATIEAVKLGIGVKTIPYVLKLADFADTKNEKGEIDAEKISQAISKVLEDVPQFKNSAGGNDNGFHQVGGNGNNSGGRNEDALLKAAFGLS